LGYDLKEADQKFDFGTIPGYEILNYDDEYENHVQKFLKALTDNEELLPPYANFKNDFLTLESQIEKESMKFNNFKKALTNAACQKEILNLPETLESLISLKNKLKKQYPGTEDEFNKINGSMAEFFEKISNETQDKCENVIQPQSHIENKSKVLFLLEISC
jgi:predicted  nucleic acid-binding Zn-ribbon protein